MQSNYGNSNTNNILNGLNSEYPAAGSNVDPEFA